MKLVELPQNVVKRRLWPFQMLLVAFMLTMLAGCMNDDPDDNAYDDSLYTNPSNGDDYNDGNGTLNGVDPNGRNDYNDDAGIDQNQINEGTIQDDSFEDEAHEIIDDTEDMIKGKDGNINNP